MWAYYIVGYYDGVKLQKACYVLWERGVGIDVKFKRKRMEETTEIPHICQQTN